MSKPPPEDRLNQILYTLILSLGSLRYSPDTREDMTSALLLEYALSLSINVENQSLPFIFTCVGAPSVLHPAFLWIMMLVFSNLRPD